MTQAIKNLAAKSQVWLPLIQEKKIGKKRKKLQTLDFVILLGKTILMIMDHKIN